MESDLLNDLTAHLGDCLTVAFGALWLFCIRLFLIDAFPPVSVGEGFIIFVAPLVVVGLGVFSLVSYIRDPGGRGGSVGD